MRLDSLFPLLLVAAVACGGDDDDDDGDTDDGSGRDAGETAGDAGGDDAGRPDAAPPDTDGGSTGDVCGGLGNLKCSETHFCDWPDDSCGLADATGTCMPRPDGCDPREPSVCACDGQRYDNACEAQRAGTDVAQVGICSPAAPP